MKSLLRLQPGDSVELIAPASRCSDAHLESIKNFLESWQLNCIVSDTIFSKDVTHKDLLCANTDPVRFTNLKNALTHPETKAIICARGGYGSMRLIPELLTITPPANPKLFVGMSDVTALQLFLLQQWQWPVIHGSLSPDAFSMESILAVKALLLGESKTINYSVTPLNNAAATEASLQSTITGGNLAILQASVGTKWQLDGRNKIIFIEEVGERAYKIDRMLTHLTQANIFNGATAILFGDFIGGLEPNGTSLIAPVLKRFAETCLIPVVQVTGIGHGNTNFPLPLGTPVSLQLGNSNTLTCFR